jgi:hypothetical protein
MHRDPSTLTAAAISEATLFAEHLRTELARRLNPVSTAQRLRTEATRAAALPVASEQLFALALRASADAGQGAGVSPALLSIARRPDPLRQLDLRREVFRDSRGAATQLDISPFIFVAEARRIAQAGQDPRQLAGWLRTAAELNRALWDHPALPVDGAMREAMLASVPALAARAEAHLRSLASAATPKIAMPAPAQGTEARLQ